MGRFGLKIAMCPIFTLKQIEHANYEYNTRQCLERLRDFWLRMIKGSEWL